MIKNDKHVNRTGIATSPMQAQVLVEAAQTTPASAQGEVMSPLELRRGYADLSGPIGSIPPPASGRGAEKAARKGGAVLLDKLGERLAFERSGVRLYDALLDKLEIYGTWDGGPTRDDLEKIHDEELEHFHLLKDMLEELGADASAVTPSADLAGVIAMGLPLAVLDPRTSLHQCLEAVLVAELVDNDGWEALEDLAQAVGDDGLLPDLAHALQEEREHLRLVREWYAAGLSQQATGGIAESFEDRARRRELAYETTTGGLIDIEIEEGPASEPPERTRERGRRRAPSRTRRPSSARSGTKKKKKARATPKRGRKSTAKGGKSTARRGR
jgi:rubrerythrin